MKKRAGFTLIEVLAVVLLTGIVLGVATNFYLDLSRASQRAAVLTREARRTSAVLDRLVRDLEGTVYVHRPATTDPLAHPWIFLAESDGSPLGADRVKFVTRTHDPRRNAVPESDLAVVAYTLRRGEEGGLELWRSEAPQFPAAFEHAFPAQISDGEELLADGIGAFGLSFADTQRQITTLWDSASGIGGGDVPIFVEIQLAMAEPGEERPLEELTIRRRTVQLGVRPYAFEPAEELDEDGEDQDEEEGLGSKTVCDCIDCNSLAANPSTARLLQEIGSKPAKQWLSTLPASLRRRVLPACR